MQTCETFSRLTTLAVLRRRRADGFFEFFLSAAGHGARQNTHTGSAPCACSACEQKLQFKKSQVKWRRNFCKSKGRSRTTHSGHKGHVQHASMVRVLEAASCKMGPKTRTSRKMRQGCTACVPFSALTTSGSTAHARCCRNERRRRPAPVVHSSGTSAMHLIIPPVT